MKVLAWAAFSGCVWIGFILLVLLASLLLPLFLSIILDAQSTTCVWSSREGGVAKVMSYRLLGDVEKNNRMSLLRLYRVILFRRCALNSE